MKEQVAGIEASHLVPSTTHTKQAKAHMDMAKGICCTLVLTLVLVVWSPLWPNMPWHLMSSAHFVAADANVVGRLVCTSHQYFLIFLPC